MRIEHMAVYVQDREQAKEFSCKYFGSSFEGRILGSKNILGSVYKAPIIVEELYFSSPYLFSIIS